ncbi:RNA polymerase subunit sigma [Streptomyces spongiicola]|uniref:RNA polymerase subunit sigma n=1 Tax=Streptomyces spongiicola TaxID=1690221 RepID=A0ABM6VCE7_9ACTN|nr:ECF RNA polymerase sigma factor SigK [Streptomyces spongiicola]AWK11983.1 RNA polymerase subunit sigma [Streptomyces spongiicola]
MRGTPLSQPASSGPSHPAEPRLDETMRRVACGDKEAFTALYDAVADTVFGIVLKVVRDRAQSEEVAQEVMIDLWRRAPRYDPGKGSVHAWAAMLAHRRAVDRVRSAEAAAHRDHDHAVRDHQRPYDDVAERVESRLQSQQVRRCMKQLTDIQRQAVTLAYYQGLTYREVAQTLGTPLPTVKTRMRDGLIRLRDCMGVTA